MRTIEGVNISIKNTTLFVSVLLMFFLILGAVAATEADNVTSTDGPNLIVDDNKLSSDDSGASNNISRANEDNLDDYPNTVLTSNDGNTNTNLQASNDGDSNSSTIKTSLIVQSARYSKTATVVKVVLKDNTSKTIKNQKVSLTLNGKTYSANTSSNGGAYIEVPSLKIGSYSVTAKFNGNSQYAKSVLKTTLYVYSSISKVTNTVTKYGEGKYITATFWNNTHKVANSNVKFILNNKTYTVKTDSNGIGKIPISLSPGEYKLKIYNPVSKENVYKTITVKKADSKLTGSNEYILPKTKFSYTVVLKNKQNQVIKNAKIYFTYNNKQVTAITNENGEATITISALPKGTYTISYQYKGNGKYNSASGTKKLYVQDSTTTLKASNLKMQYNDGSSFSVKATDASGKALSNKTITFTLNGKTTKVTTDSNGVAKLAIGSLKPNTYTVKYTYSTAGSKDYNAQTKSVIISKQNLTITANDLVMKYNDGTNYQVTVTNLTGKAVNGVVVQFTLNGKSTKVTTDANGIAKLAITENIGYYPIKAQIVDSDYYTSPKVTKYILVNGTKFSASNIILPENTAGTFEVKLLDAQNKAVKNTAVKFTLNGKTSSVKTDENGTAKLTISGLTAGNYTVTYTDGSASGSSIIFVMNKVTLKEVITASQNVKKYIENNGELPNTVKIGSVTYSTAIFVYLASQAIINLKNNNKNDISVKTVNDPTSPKAAANLGNLYNYLSVAKSIVNTVNSKGTMPNSVSSEVGTIGYNAWVYAVARTVAFYGDNGIMPNYVTIKTYGSSSSSSSLNSKNTIKDLTPYLKSSTNCQVGNSKIKSLVNSLTSGLTSDTAKAKAIYNYVRDYISYSFYYDTKYGAVGTLNAKTGNCVDQAHLLIAMYRTAGLAARYVHGTCYFTSSGSTYGHVWAQVLIGDTWIVSDPTSSRNSFGNVVNWNNYNYQLKGYYPSISF